MRYLLTGNNNFIYKLVTLFVMLIPLSYADLELRRVAINPESIIIVENDNGSMIHISSLAEQDKLNYLSQEYQYNISDIRQIIKNAIDENLVIDLFIEETGLDNHAKSVGVLKISSKPLLPEYIDNYKVFNDYKNLLSKTKEQLLSAEQASLKLNSTNYEKLNNLNQAIKNLQTIIQIGDIQYSPDFQNTTLQIKKIFSSIVDSIFSKPQSRALRILGPIVGSQMAIINLRAIITNIESEVVYKTKNLYQILAKHILITDEIEIETSSTSVDSTCKEIIEALQKITTKVNKL